MKTLITLGVIAILALAGMVGYLLYPETNTVEEQVERLGSVTVANEYMGTSTQTASGITDPGLIKSGRGALGSIIIEKTGTGFTLYDATTTDILGGNSARGATTSLILAHSDGQAAGTFTYDVWFTNGLLIDMVTAGTIASTTITYR